MGSGGKPNKRTLLEAFREFTAQTTPPSKRAPIVPNATDTIRVEVNKVLNPPQIITLFVSQGSLSTLFERIKTSNFN
jgi:hypothetical protein